LTMYYNALVNAELRHATRPRQYFSSIWPSITLQHWWLMSLCQLSTDGSPASSQPWYHDFPPDLMIPISSCTNSLTMPLFTKATLDGDTFYEPEFHYIGKHA
jgi:hypothetical protein